MCVVTGFGPKAGSEHDTTPAPPPDLDLDVAASLYYQAGQEGQVIGWRGAEAAMAERWNRAAGAVVACNLGPSFAELEARRWGPGGRARFGDPQPGDFTGRGAEPEQEAEAG